MQNKDEKMIGKKHGKYQFGDSFGEGFDRGFGEKNQYKNVMEKKCQRSHFKNQIRTRLRGEGMTPYIRIGLHWITHPFLETFLLCFLLSL